MICPHCNKPIRNQAISKEIRQKIYKLHKQGYSARDIQEKLGVSFSSAARIVREINAEKLRTESERQKVEGE